MSEKKVVVRKSLPVEPSTQMQEIADAGDARKAALSSKPSQHGQPEYEGQKPKSIEVTLDDGRVVVMGPPNVGTSLIVQRILSDESINNPIAHAMMQLTVEALMYVREVDGESINRPITMPDVQHLLNLLGDGGISAVEVAYQGVFKQKTFNELNVVKKY